MKKNELIEKLVDVVSSVYLQGDHYGMVEAILKVCEEEGALKEEFESEND